MDAINFVNKGKFNLVTLDPFTTSETLNFSNLVSFPGSGVMTASPGWKFDWEPVNNGQVHTAASFFNGNLGVIQSLDPQNTIIIGQPNLSLVSPSKLFITATNIISNGGLSVGANGWLEMHGHHIDLSRGVLEATPVSSEALGSFNNVVPGYFLPDIAVSDVFWGQTNMTFDSSSLWDGFNALTPVFGAQGPGGVTGTFQFGFGASYADANINIKGVLPLVITNNDGSFTIVNLITNIYKQAVLVGAANGMTVSDGFRPSSVPFSNFFSTVSVLLSLSISNPVTAGSDVASIYIQDQLASESGRGLLMNIVNNSTLRPTNYLVSRINQGMGAPGNYGYPSDPDFFQDSGNSDTNILSDIVTNPIVSGAYSGYGASFDNIVTEPISLPTGTVTNLPGRVRIYADELDLTKTRIRGEGEIIIQTAHLISSTNTVIDCQNLSLNLGSTNGNLKVQSLAGSGVRRMTGPVYLWSAVWSNSVEIILNNFTLDTNAPTGYSPAPLTNIITVNYHTLMVDATQVRTSIAVNVYDLIMRSTNVVMNDDATVVQSFFTDGLSFTLNGNVTFSSATLQNAFGPAGTVSLTDWMHTNAPNILHFTNNGSLTIPNEAHFGDDGPLPYTDFINNGTINAYDIQWNSAFFESSGTLGATGPMSVQGGAGKFQNGSTSAGGDAWFSCDSLKFNNHQLSVNGHAYFNVTSSLFDTGSGSGNTFQFQDGFSLLIKPDVGDLLGTTFHSVAPNLVSPSVEVDHYWAGADLGANASGYQNNEAIGQLILSSSSKDPLFVFTGTTNANGLYVDLLDLSALGADYQNLISINPNLTIYYAAAKLDPSVTLPPLTEPEEYLDGQFGGHLRWVSCFAGPNSSTAVVINGQSYEVNSALRNSKIIDSNTNGLANGNDPFPFSSVPCGVQALSAKPFVSITAPAQGQAVVTAAAQVQGSAGTTNGSMAYVYYQVNSNGWIPATSINGGANWSGAVNFSFGNNVVQAYSQDAQGNKSPVQSVNVRLLPGAPITVTVNGGGSVVSNYNGQLLALNQTYTMTAYPGNGFAFSNWTGSVFPPSKNPQLTFVMKSNLTFFANFVPQTFAPSVASYSGLFYQADEVRPSKSGGFSVTTAKNGGYSGNLQVEGNTFPFSGKFNGVGASSATNKNGGFRINLQMDTTDNSSITGIVATATWAANFEALRAAAGAFAGNYTFVIPGSDDVNDANVPFGDGYATATVKPGGTVQSSVFLAGGEPQVTPSATVSQDGRWPLYASLYQGKGQILGWLAFTNSGEADLTGWVSWIKPAIPGAKFYPGGFDITNSVTGSAYYSTTNPVTRFTNGAVVLTSGNLIASVSNNVAVGLNNKVTNLGSNKLTLTLTKSSGLFSGTATPTNSKAVIKINGVILQKQKTGTGYFLGTNQTGQVSFGP